MKNSSITNTTITNTITNFITVEVATVKEQLFILQGKTVVFATFSGDTIADGLVAIERGFNHSFVGLTAASIEAETAAFKAASIERRLYTFSHNNSLYLVEFNNSTDKVKWPNSIVKIIE